jgi:hypothetical protein
MNKTGFRFSRFCGFVLAALLLSALPETFAEAPPNGSNYVFSEYIIVYGIPGPAAIYATLYYQPDNPQGAPDPWAVTTSTGQHVAYRVTTQGWYNPGYADAWGDAYFSGTRISSADADYNCHSYASSVTTSYCIGNGYEGIRRVYTDSNAYEFIGDPEDRCQGDIVCWSDYGHSAVIKAVNPSTGQITEVREKQGHYGIYDRTTDLPTGSLLVYTKK